MQDRIRCPVCGGDGFEKRWESASDMEQWHRTSCAECNGYGFVMATNHDPKPAVMESQKTVTITQHDGWPDCLICGTRLTYAEYPGHYYCANCGGV